MRDKFRRSVSIWESEGTITLSKRILAYIYDTIVSVAHPRGVYFEFVRPRTNISREKSVCLNGVEVHVYRSFDKYTPWDFAPRGPSDEFESGAVAALESHVSKGDTVVVIGGGRGITATIAAWETGDEGRVIAYEGAADRVEQIIDTARTNGVRDVVKPRHAVVGTAHRLDGPSRGANAVSPAEIPDCDVLEMDCEGAETSILSELTIRPDWLIVETHGNRAEIRDRVSDLGYRVESESSADDRLSEEQITNMGLYTVVARRVE